jgi:CRP-like cAMP-binding protein
VRWLYLFGGLLTVGCGVWGLVLPGIGQPATEWRKALQLLRSAPVAVTKGIGRSVLPSDVDMLVGLIPTLADLPRSDRERIITQGSVVEVQPGTKLMQAGELGDDAYFVLQGKAVAGIAEEGGRYHSLSSMGPGDYFGEIAALTGAPRTADVVAEESSQLLHVPGTVLRVMMAQPDFSKIILSRMSERLARTSIHELPRMAGISPQDARELRKEPAEAKQLEMEIS